MTHVLSCFTVLCICCSLQGRAQQTTAPTHDTTHSGLSVTGTTNADTLLTDPATRARSEIFSKVEKEPIYPGGPGAWVRDLKNALKQNSASLDDDGVTSMGTCEVQFVVWYDGTAGNVRALTMDNSRLAEVVTQFIQHTSRWTPARQNGYVVNTYLKVKVKYPQ